MAKCLVRLKSAETPIFADGLQLCPHPPLITADTPASGAKVTCCACSAQALAASAQTSNVFFIIYVFI